MVSASFASPAVKLLALAVVYESKVPEPALRANVNASTGTLMPHQAKLELSSVQWFVLVVVLKRDLLL